jgi:hypothetical protein
VENYYNGKFVNSQKELVQVAEQGKKWSSTVSSDVTVIYVLDHKLQNEHTVVRQWFEQERTVGFDSFFVVQWFKYEY